MGNVSFKLSHSHVVVLSLLHIYNWICILDRWLCIAEINGIVSFNKHCAHVTGYSSTDNFKCTCFMG